MPNGALSLWSVMVLLVFLGFAIGVMQGSTLNLGARLPSKYMGAIFLGNGYSAIFINLIRAVCLLALPKDNEFLSSLVYFIVAAVLMTGTALVFLRFQRLPIVIYYLERAEGAGSEKEGMATTMGSVT